MDCSTNNSIETNDNGRPGMGESQGGNRGGPQGGNMGEPQGGNRGKITSRNMGESHGGNRGGQQGENMGNKGGLHWQQGKGGKKTKKMIKPKIIYKRL